MKGLPDASVDCFICDLPYGCLVGGGMTTMSEENRKAKYKNNTGATLIGCAWDVKINLELFWEQVKRLRKADNTPCLMFCTTRFGNDLINSNPKEFRYDLVWDKQRGVSFLTANKMPMRSHEMVYIFSKAGAYYKRVDIKGDFRPSVGGGKGSNVYNQTSSTKGTGSTTTRCVLSVIKVAGSAKQGAHPTEKPMALYKFLIERYCPADGVILDPTAGSFNSCFTAYEMGRDAIGIEKDDGFFKKAKARAEAML